MAIAGGPLRCADIDRRVGQRVVRKLSVELENTLTKQPGERNCVWLLNQINTARQEQGRRAAFGIA
jgi:hypothetical protein